MAHARYESECLVLEAGIQGEANAHYLLLTKEFGLLRGSAQGVRLSTGKMRYALQEYSLLNISLVRGKEFWRIVGAEPKEHFWGPSGLSFSQLQLVAKLFRLIKRLVVGEERHQELYSAVLAALLHIRTKEYSGEELLLLEILMVARILTLLGYFKVTDEYAPLLEADTFEPEVLARVEKTKSQLLVDINRALTETQL